MQFNFIAQFYDRLNRIVFGTRVEKAKTSLFDYIAEGSKVLFVGGGTGASLHGLLNTNKKLTIDFVDSSHKMIALAKKRVKSNSNVNFYATDIEKFSGGGYDFIITEFFFDLFTKDTIIELVDLLSKKLNSKGNYINTDFRNPSNFKSSLILKLMYLFFKITAKLKSNKLVNTQPIFEERSFKIKKELKFSAGFISSQLIVAI